MLAPRSVSALFLAVLSLSVGAQQHNCDCTQITGSCEAAIMVQPTEATKGSFGADLHIRSTAPICSKVDYYVDSTPYFTVLSQGNSFTDRVFGTSPVTRDTISDVRCRTCKVVNAGVVPQGAGDPQAGTAPTDANLAGAWTTFQSCYGVTGGGRIELRQANDGTYAVSGEMANVSVDSGTVSNGGVTIQASNFWGNKVRFTGRLLNNRRMQGTYTQTTSRPGPCDWEADKVSP